MRYRILSKVVEILFFSVNSIYKIFLMSFILDLLVIRFVMGFLMLVFRSNFIFMLEFYFNISLKINGYIMLYNGLVGGFFGIFVGYILKFYNYNDVKMLLYFLFIFIVLILGIIFLFSIFFVVVFIVLFVVLSVVLRVCVINFIF